MDTNLFEGSLVGMRVLKIICGWSTAIYPDGRKAGNKKVMGGCSIMRLEDLWIIRHFK